MIHKVTSMRRTQIGMCQLSRVMYRSRNTSFCTISVYTSTVSSNSGMWRSLLHTHKAYQYSPVNSDARVGLNDDHRVMQDELTYVRNNISDHCFLLSETLQALGSEVFSLRYLRLVTRKLVKAEGSWDSRLRHSCVKCDEITAMAQ